RGGPHRRRGGAPALDRGARRSQRRRRRRRGRGARPPGGADRTRGPLREPVRGLGLARRDGSRVVTRTRFGVSYPPYAWLFDARTEGTLRVALDLAEHDAADQRAERADEAPVPPEVAACGGGR